MILFTSSNNNHSISFILICFVLFLPTSCLTKRKTSIIGLDVGKIRGFTMKLGHIKADYFYGVPFAEPPINENRFEKPIPIKPWTGIRTAYKRKQYCMQLTVKKPESRYSEDCLYMNIIRPHNRPDKLLPVMLVIHAGGFEYGGASNFGVRSNRGMSLLNYNVIIVAIQYRLGVYGFASSGEHDLPGNLGYFDQAEALKFVHRNIRKFGGDPARITLYGFSAGGASATALSVSPITRDLFNQVIAMSGSSMAIWANSNMTVDSTHQLVKVLGLKANETIKERLKRATHSEIFNATMEIGTTIYSQNFGRFTPRMDGDFFPKDIPELIEESPPKHIVIGMETQESLIRTLTRPQNYSKSMLVIPMEKRHTFSGQDLQDSINQLITPNIYGNNTHEVRNKVFTYYSATNETVDKNNVFYLRRYAQLVSDLQFNMAIIQEIYLRSQSGWTVFPYYHSYINERKFSKHSLVKDAYHGTDKQYAKYILGINRARNDDQKMEKNTIQWIVKFVKTGNPSSTDFEWLPTDKKFPLRYAHLGTNPIIKDHFWLGRLKFWTKLAQEYKYDQIRMQPLTNTSIINSIAV